MYLSLSLSLCISLYLRFLCLSRSTLNFRLTACWARCRKLSRCHCNTHLIRLVARLHWWFIVLLPTAFAPLLILPLFLLFLPLLLQAACRAIPSKLFHSTSIPVVAAAAAAAAAKQLTLMDHGNFFAFFHCAIPAVRVNWQK